MAVPSLHDRGVHGILMITAWMLCASISIMVARFFRAIPGPKLLGGGVWFNIHRGLMVCTLGLTISSFIFIFVKAGVWEHFQPPWKSAHAYIGTFVTFLVILNPILAMVRPPLDGNRRVFFNWVHWCVGMSAWILAMINIMFGMYMLNLGATSPEVWVFVAFIVEHGLTDMMFTKFQIEDTKRIERAIGAGIQKVSEGSESLQISEAPQMLPSRAVVMFRYGWMIFYCVDVVAYWIAMVVLISNRT